VRCSDAAAAAEQSGAAVNSSATEHRRDTAKVQLCSRKNSTPDGG